MVIVNKPSGTWWKCLLAFLGGMLTTVLIIVGGGAAAGTMYTTSQLLGFAGLDPNEYLTAEYQNKTVLDIVMEAVDGTLTFNTLGDIAKVTPKVDDVFEAVNSVLQNEVGFVLDYNDFKDVPFAELDKEIIAAFKSGFNLAGLLKADSTSNAIIQYLCFKKDPSLTYKTETLSIDSYVSFERIDLARQDPSDESNRYYTATGSGASGLLPGVGNFEIEIAKPSEWENVYVYEKNGSTDQEKRKWPGSLVSESGGKYIYEFDDVNYDTFVISDGEKYNYDMKYTLEDMLNDDFEGTGKSFFEYKIDGITLQDVMPAGSLTPGNPLYALRDKTFSELQDGDVFKTLKIGDFIDTSAMGPGDPLYAIKDYTIEDLEDPATLKGLKVSDFVDTSGLAPGDPMYALKDYTLEDLEDADTMKSLTIGDFVDTSGLSEGDPMYALKDKTLAELEDPDTFTSLHVYELMDTSGLSEGDPVYAIKDLTIAQLTDGTTVKNLELSQFVEINDGSPAILKNFKENHVTIGGLNDAINNLKVGDVFDYEEDDIPTLPAVMRTLIASSNGSWPGEKVTSSTYLLNGTSYQRFFISDGGKTNCTKSLVISNFREYTDINLNYEDGKWLASGSGASGHMETVKNFEVEIHKPAGWSDLYVYQYNTDNGKSVSNLDTVMEDLTLGDVIDLSPDDVLYKIKDQHINDGDALFTEMKNTFTIKDVMGDMSGNKFLSCLDEDTLIKDISTEINNIRVLDVFKEEIYKDYPTNTQVNPTWKMLLTEYNSSTKTFEPALLDEADPFHRNQYVEDPNNAGTIVGGKYVYKCNDYKLGDSMSKMMQNMQDHMSYDTLNNLNASGLISFNQNPGFLTTAIPDYMKTTSPYKEIVGTKQYYGELTMTEFVDLMSINIH